MTDPDVDEDARDEFTTEGECWAWRAVPGVIGAPQHHHVCRELVDDEGRHDGRHHCSKCDTDF